MAIISMVYKCDCCGVTVNCTTPNIENIFLEDNQDLCEKCWNEQEGTDGVPNMETTVLDGIIRGTR